MENHRPGGYDVNNTAAETAALHNCKLQAKERRCADRLIRAPLSNVVFKLFWLFPKSSRAYGMGELRRCAHRHADFWRAAVEKVGLSWRLMSNEWYEMRAYQGFRP